MHTIHALTTLVFAAGALTAQANPVAYPQNGTDGSSGQIVPLGFSTSSTNFDEGRWQQLIPARLMPSSGGLIVAIDFLPQMSMTTQYQSLMITFGDLPAGTNSLSSTYASNMTAPQVVYQQTNPSFTWSQRQWQTVQLMAPYVYDPSKDFVLDIQKIYDRAAFPPPGLAHHQITSNPGRSDLPATRYSFSPLGGGGATTPTATNSTRPMKVRLRFVGIPTQTLTGLRGGSNNNVFAIGAPFDATVHGFAGNPTFSAISVGYSPGPLTIPGIGGAFLIDFLFAFVYASGPIPPGGERTTAGIVLPNSPGLVGLNGTFQTLSADSNGLLTWTNVADMIINN